MLNSEQKEIGTKKLGILFNLVYTIVVIKQLLFYLPSGEKIKLKKQGLEGETNSTF